MDIISIVLAAVAAFVVGFLLHGPVLGGLWMKLANIHPTGKEKLSDMWKQMAANMGANLLSATVLSGLFVLVFSSPFMGPATAFRGALCAAWVWLGFMVTSSSMEVIWMGRTYKLWLFEAMCSLITMMTMGAILGGW